MKGNVSTVLVISFLSVAACTSANADKNEPSFADGKPGASQKITVPAGTHIDIVLSQDIGTDVSSAGSKFRATLLAPVEIDGRTILERGTKVTGRIVDLKKAGQVKGSASLSIELVSLQYQGKNIPIETDRFVGSTKNRDAKVIAGAAGVGAIVGAILGGGKGATTGAVVGGAGGAGTAMASGGDELHFPPETRVVFVLTKAIAI